MSMNRTYVGAILGASILVVVSGVYWFNDLKKVKDATPLDSREVTQPLSAPSTGETPRSLTRYPQSGYAHYWNDVYQFSLFHPQSMRIQELPGENRTVTVVFQDPETLEGFQVYITPYFSSTISEEQFRADVPSGVRLNEQKVELAGVEAVYFESEDGTLGPTLEVWSIHHGYLYEITTTRDQAPLLEQVLGDWKYY